ncbi:MAG: hypothetical protein K9H16_07555 [Bacteroidales bacterium]|nr:hypothetical protein [Bacteroidales bacterium]
MKTIFYSFILVVLMTFTSTTFSQTPPPPNGGETPGQGGNTPVGGGAPISGGISILLAMGAVYGAKKVYNHLKRNPAEELSNQKEKISNSISGNAAKKVVELNRTCIGAGRLH